MRFVTQLLGTLLILLGIYFLSKNIFFTTNISPYFWRGVAADLSILCLVAGTVWLAVLPAGTKSYGWIFIVTGIIFIFFSSRAILTPTSLWQFFISFGAIVSGYKMLVTGKLPI